MATHPSNGQRHQERRLEGSDRRPRLLHARHRRQAPIPHHRHSQGRRGQRAQVRRDGAGPRHRQGALADRPPSRRCRTRDTTNATAATRPTRRSPTASTCGRHFGSFGLYCYDVEGNLVWKKELPKMRMRMAFGEGGAAAMAGDRLILMLDQESGSTSWRSTRTTGKELWRKERDESEHVVHAVGGRRCGDRQRHEQGARLRCRYRRYRVGVRRSGRERDSGAGGGRWASSS